MNLTIFQNPYEFKKKTEASTVQLLVQSVEKFLRVIWNGATKTYPKFLTSSLFFKTFQIFFKNVKYWKNIDS